MNSAEFIKSLAVEQSVALNVLLVEQRDAINVMRDEAMRELVTVKNGELFEVQAMLKVATEEHINTSNSYTAIEKEREAILLEAVAAEGDPVKLGALVERIALPFVDQQKSKARQELEVAKAEIESKLAEL